MFQIAIITTPPMPSEAIGVLRGHLSLTVAELRERVLSGKPVAEYELADIADIRRSRRILQDLDRLGLKVRVFENVEGFDEQEESVKYLRNVMRRNIQSARQLRAEDTSHTEHLFHLRQ